MRRHPQLIEAAGGRCVTGDRAGRVEVLSLEQLAAADPEVIVLVPCGYDLERGARELLQTPLLQSDGAHGSCAMQAAESPAFDVSSALCIAAAASQLPAVKVECAGSNFAALPE